MYATALQILRWMYSHAYPKSASPDNERIIQPQCGNGCASGCRLCNDFYAISTPHKMFTPTLPSRIEERNFCP